MEALRVLAGERLHESRDGAFKVAPRDQVEMVGHEAVGEDVDLAGVSMVSEEVEEEDVVAVGMEGPLAVVAALGDMEVVLWGGEA